MLWDRGKQVPHKVPGVSISGRITFKTLRQICRCLGNRFLGWVTVLELHLQWWWDHWPEIERDFWWFLLSVYSRVKWISGDKSAKVLQKFSRDIVQPFPCHSRAWLCQGCLTFLPVYYQWGFFFLSSLFERPLFGYFGLCVDNKTQRFLGFKIKVHCNRNKFLQITSKSHAAILSVSCLFF